MGARFDQHFLVNLDAADRIVEEAVRAGGPVLEIGPGKGVLTGGLVARAPLVVAVELDAALSSALRTRYAGLERFTVHNVDILKFDLRSLPPPPRPSPYAVVGNLPYGITSPILRRLSEWTGWASAVLMMQKEVGDRICGKTGTAAYGALTIGVRLVAEADRLFDLAPGSFRPPPRVHSSVLRLTRRAVPLTARRNETERVVQAAFQQRRKTLENALSHGLGIPKEEANRRLVARGIDPRIRGERVSPEGFIGITDDLIAHGLL